MHTSVRPAAVGDTGTKPPKSAFKGIYEALTKDRKSPLDRLSFSTRPLGSGVITLIGLALGIGILVAATLDRRLSTDVFWTMAAGQWMLQHHHVMGPDRFSYTETHRNWIADEWGSEVALAALYKLVGAAAYNLIAIITGTACLVSTVAYARALGARGGRLAIIAVLMALGIMNFVTQDRGLSFSLIWFPLELLILTKARSNPRWLAWLPLLCLVWVNTHGSILLGLVVIGAELAWSFTPTSIIERLSGVGRSTHSRALALAGLGAVVASCLSPYGPGLLAYDLKVAGSPQIGRYIEEWQPPNFHSVFVLLLVGIPLAVFVVAMRRRPVLLLETTLTIALLIATLHSVRMVIYLIVVCAGLAAAHPFRPTWRQGIRRLVGAGTIGMLIVVAALPSVPAGSVTPDTPVQAFNYLASHPGRIFTQYTWGDYAITRHRKTFVDGRTDLFLGTVLNEYFAISQLTTDPDPILTHWDVAYVVWARNTPLAEYLEHDSHWQVIDRTSQALVFGRAS